MGHNLPKSKNNNYVTLDDFSNLKKKRQRIKGQVINKQNVTYFVIFKNYLNINKNLNQKLTTKRKVPRYLMQVFNMYIAKDSSRKP